MPASHKRIIYKKGYIKSQTLVWVDDLSILKHEPLGKDESDDSLLYGTVRITNSAIRGDEIHPTEIEEFTAQLMLWSAYEALRREKTNTKGLWKDAGEMKNPFLKKIREIWDGLEEQGFVSSKRPYSMERDVLLFLWYLCTEGYSKLLAEKPNDEREYSVRIPKVSISPLKRS